jgi:hypothetical protein
MGALARQIVSGSLFVFTVALIVAVVYAQGPNFVPNGAHFPNPGGTSHTYSTAFAIDLTGPFFQNLGTNPNTIVTIPIRAATFRVKTTWVAADGVRNCSQKEITK